MARVPISRTCTRRASIPSPAKRHSGGYWSKHALLGCIDLDTTPLHRKLLEAVGSDNYFVLTTNVDRQFEKAGVPQDKIFATQGSYTHIQCARGCHQKTYDATKLFLEMNARRQGTEIPSALVPHCPVCGGPMAMNLRQDNTFVEDDDWHRAEAAFSSFLDDALEGNLVLLEVGCGFNTPTIVRFPFEKLCRQHKNVHLIRLNLNEAIVPQSISAKSVCINADMAKSITDLAEAVAERKSES